MLSSLINLSEMIYKGNIVSVVSAYSSIIFITVTMGSVVAVVFRLIK
jgi:hypothetical protein